VTKNNQKIALSFLYFFLVIATFWTLKPLRTSEVIKAFGVQYYPVFKQGLLVFMPAILSGYFMLSCFFNRARLVYFF